MPGRSWCGIIWIALAVVACHAGDTSVDPSDLELRDLLGIAPDVASQWRSAERAAARRVLAAGLRDAAAPASRMLPPGSDDLDARVAQLLAADDAARESAGAGALGAVRVAIDAPRAAIARVAAPRAAAALGDEHPRPAVLGDEHPRPAVLGDEHPRAAVLGDEHPRAAVLGDDPSRPAAALDDGSPPRAAAPDAELWLAPSWNAEPGAGPLPGRGAGLLAALAGDAGHPGGPVVVVPAPRLAVIAAYVERDDDPTALPRLAINPIALAALEPAPGEAAATTAMPRWSPPPAATDPARADLHDPRNPHDPAVETPIASTGGNPYSFYGSVAECAAAQRARCQACLPGGTCRPITSTSDGNAECMMLDASSGRGYFLLCVNLALAITSVDRCTGDAAPSCPRDPNAADSLATLEANAGFLDNAACGGALDACLAKIYGPPGDPFPGPDGGTPPVSPPRSTSVSCGKSCDSPNTTCNASPSCDCSGPSCNNSLSCDSACASSNDQRGCGGDCNTCTSSGSGGGGGCSGNGSSSSDGCGGGSGGSCSSGSGGSCNSGCSGSGNSCGGSGNSCSSSGSGNSCSSSGGGGGGKCSVAITEPTPGLGLAMSVTWGALPVALAGLVRRRTRRRQPRRADGDPDRDGDGALTDTTGAAVTRDDTGSAGNPAPTAPGVEAAPGDANHAGDRASTDPPTGEPARDDDNARDAASAGPPGGEAPHPESAGTGDRASTDPPTGEPACDDDNARDAASAGPPGGEAPHPESAGTGDRASADRLDAAAAGGEAP